MILKLILMPLWFLINFLISLLPDTVISGAINSTFFDLLAKGVSIVGIGNFSMMMGSVLFWYSVQLAWAIIEWIYRKIPGVS